MIPPRALLAAFATAVTAAVVIGLLQDRPGLAAALVGGLSGVLALRLARSGAALEEARARAAEAERLATVGLATAGFAHELKNATMVLQGFAELARKGVPEGDRSAAHLAEVDHQARRLTELLQRFLRLGHGGATGVARPVGEVLDEIVRLGKPVAHVRNVVLETELAADLARPVDDGRTRALLLDLLLNATAHAYSRIRVRAEAGGGEVVIRVEDDGPGVPAAERERVFEPFVTARAGGTGLGLATARAGARDEGGSLTCEASELGGAAFVLRLPAAPAGAPG